MLSVDGIGAYDLISRQAMLRALRNTPDAACVLPFVRLFYGQPSTFLWRDDAGVVHRIVQAEGGEQGDRRCLLWASPPRWRPFSLRCHLATVCEPSLMMCT